MSAWLQPYTQNMFHPISYDTTVRCVFVLKGFDESVRYNYDVVIGFI